MGEMRTLGADLRSLRKSRGLTLEEVSGRLGKSVGWLSQVERDLSTPEPQDLDRLSEIFGVPLSLVAVSDAPEAEDGRIVRKSARRAIGERVPGLDESLLSPDLTDDFEVLHSTFLPGSNRSDRVDRATSEVGVILSGKLDLWLGEDKFTVGEGDSFRIRDETLRWANPYDVPAVAIWVISPPVY
ncbi:putative transcriptional regulator [Candidatus Rhodobacter oscarellae]|uniref:Putative transcriptional regulator n=1 Tax=Candidatus Rhodobacter oscarellae TaxID=1675527 RepID=A0A0J9GX99_9RHOB|nr:XRE family transcriptional regulator [Candidatus Rhodobacter lobularis]KMW58113.1 putative transcriptional regulator [Candidatus Rhodobacter lobularis]